MNSRARAYLCCCGATALGFVACCQCSEVGNRQQLTNGPTFQPHRDVGRDDERQRITDWIDQKKAKLLEK